VQSRSGSASLSYFVVQTRRPELTPHTSSPHCVSCESQRPEIARVAKTLLQQHVNCNNCALEKAEGNIGEPNKSLINSHCGAPISLSLRQLIRSARLVCKCIYLHREGAVEGSGGAWVAAPPARPSTVGVYSGKFAVEPTIK